MKKKICTQLFRLSAAALACTALLSGASFCVEPGEYGNGNPPVIDIQDEIHDTECNDEENKGNLPPEESGIQPQNDWENETLKN